VLELSDNTAHIFKHPALAFCKKERVGIAELGSEGRTVGAGRVLCGGGCCADGCGRLRVGNPWSAERHPGMQVRSRYLVGNRGIGR